ncbi:MAG: class I SAM-dependent methyltransferase [Bacilli bacterium]|jgi:predicted O-methyltransferase YrrM|nr:class I SAM-dependent methyltransferase [Bacilli bacterium]
MEDKIKIIKQKALDNKIPIIEDETALFLKELIVNNQVKTILEIGSAVGYSAIYMASITNNIKVDSIEKDNERFVEAVNNVTKVQLLERIRIINEDALNIDLTLLNEKYDLIFVDGPKAQYIRLVSMYEKLLKKDGYFVFDNIDFHGMVNDISLTNNRNTKQLVKKIRNFIEWINNNDNYQIAYYKLGDGIIKARKVDEDE